MLLRRAATVARRCSAQAQSCVQTQVRCGVTGPSKLVSVIRKAPGIMTAAGGGGGGDGGGGGGGMLGWLASAGLVLAGAGGMLVAQQYLTRHEDPVDTAARALIESRVNVTTTACQRMLPRPQ